MNFRCFKVLQEMFWKPVTCCDLCSGAVIATPVVAVAFPLLEEIRSEANSDYL